MSYSVAGYFISSSNFEKFINKLISDADVFAPLIIEDRPRLKKIDPTNISSIDLKSYRTSEPIKSLFLKAREDVSKYFGGPKDIKISDRKKVVFCKSCDIKALIFEDKFFSDEINDPFYTKIRNNTIIISSDCGDAISTCHCTMVDVKPYPEKYFDLNMSSIKDGYLIDVGSKIGQEVIDDNKALFVDGTPGQREEQAKSREAILNKVLDINKKYQYKTKLEEPTKKGLENEVWRDIAKSCTECGGCNMVCPTCTCFLLYDEKKGDYYVRGKEWDSCMKAGYARVAGGANTRPLLYRRVQNRWQCKFDYMFDKYNMYACSGCGRCTEVCMAKIDLREVFLKLEKQEALSMKLE